MAKQSNRSGKLTASVNISSEVYNLYCDVCSEDGTHLEAEGYCADCKDYLCRDCFKGHMRTRLSRNHVLYDKTQMPQQKPSPSVSVSRTSSCTEKCARHPDRLVEYYCSDDRSLGCSVCMTVNHRLCNIVDYIPEMTYQFLDSQQYKQFTNKLNSLNSKSHSVIKSTKENVMKAEKWFSDAENMLQELRTKIIEAFDKFEGGLKSKASTIKSADIKKMQEIAEKGQAVFNEVNIISAEQQSLQNKNQLGQLFIHMMKFEDKVETLHTLLAEADTDNNVTAYTIEPGSQIQMILDDPTSIGKLSVQATTKTNMSPRTTTPVLKKTPGQPYAAQSVEKVAVAIDTSTETHALKKFGQPTVSQSAAATVITPIANNPQNTRAALVHYIKVSTNSDTEKCWISGSTLLPGNKLILADCKNNKLKLLNLQTFKVTSALRTSQPWDITSITTDQVAATLYHTRTIVFAKVAHMNILKMDREMPVDGDCRAILHNKGKLVVGFINPVKIEIMALDGTVERKIEQPGLFGSPSHMAFRLDCKSIYVADSRYYCVKRITLDGAVEAEYRNDELTCPRGIIVDKHNRVMVCGQTSCNIHLLTPDLTKAKVLVDKLDCPCSLSYCYSTCRLFVGTRGSDNMIMYVLSCEQDK